MYFDVAGTQTTFSLFRHLKDVRFKIVKVVKALKLNIQCTFLVGDLLCLLDEVF